MLDFAIGDPKLGIAENIPTVTLPEAFMAKGSVNVHERYGRYDRMRGRLPQFFDSEAVKIKTPTDIYEITGINTGTKTLTINGDHSAGATPLAEDDIIRINGGTEADNNITFTVDSLPATNKIVVAEALSAAGAIEGNVFVGTTPIIKYHRHVRKGTGTEHELMGTKYHLLLWLDSDKSMTVKFTVGDEGGNPANVERWEIKDHLRNVVATNNSDRVIWWDVDDSPGNDFKFLDQADGIDYEGTGNRLTKCKHIFSYETYLFLGFTTEAGTVFPQRVRAAGRGTGGDDVDFDENGDSDAFAKDFTDSPGFVFGFAKHNDDLVVAKKDSMHRGWVVTADTVFEWEEYALKVGCLSADSLVNDKAGRLYWFATDLTVREIQTPVPISTAADITTKGLNTTQSEFIQATYIDEFEEIWFAIPCGDSDTNDKVISFHPDSGRIVIHEFPIRAFGDFTQQEAFTYDTLPYGPIPPGEGYPGWGADWLLYDTSRNVVGFPLDIASDYEGATFALHRADKDDGNDFTGRVSLSTTFNSNRFKRVNNGCEMILNRKSSGSVDLYAKRDTESSRQFLGTASLVDSDGPETVIVHIPFDIRFRSVQFDIEGSAQFEFIGMMFYDYEDDDER